MGSRGSQYDPRSGLSSEGRSPLANAKVKLRANSSERAKRAFLKSPDRFNVRSQDMESVGAYVSRQFSVA